jgi:hypothetical protein
MKQEIIYTEHYALILGDEQTKENDWGYIRFQGGDVKLIGKYFADDWLKVIAHRPLTDAPILEGVPLMPKFTQEDDVEKKSRDFVKEIGGSQEQRLAFVDGYLEAKETYKYTEEDLRKVIEASRDIRYVTYSEDELIQSLQTKRPKYFECEIDNILSYNANDGVNALVNPSFGKRKIIINSQGQTGLVGEYIF